MACRLSDLDTACACACEHHTDTTAARFIHRCPPHLQPQAANNPPQDALDKGVSAALDKTGHHQSNSTVEKITDGFRKVFKKATGKGQSRAEGGEGGNGDRGRPMTMARQRQACARCSSSLFRSPCSFSSPSFSHPRIRRPDQGQVAVKLERQRALVHLAGPKLMTASLVNGSHLPPPPFCLFAVAKIRPRNLRHDPRPSFPSPHTHAHSITRLRNCPLR